MYSALPIPVQRIKSPVMLISGGHDRLWNSQLFAGEIMAELPHDGAAHVHLNHPRAGHIVLGIPYGPIDSELLTLGGGTPASNSAAHISDWPAAINFIKSH